MGKGEVSHDLRKVRRKQMPKYELEVAVRYLKLQFEKGVGRSTPKILAELITNSDDSYKRINPEEALAHESFGKIEIVANRRKKKFTVIDQAQGISREEMINKFPQYGEESGDRSAGWRTRSLFGKGLRDVLLTQRIGVVRSIRNGQASIANFYYGSLRRRERKSAKEAPIVDIEDHPPRVNNNIRSSWGIQENGTAVDFLLREDLSFPRRETLVAKLKNFYILRMINSDPRRKVLLRYVDSSGQRTVDEIKYSFPSGELVKESEFIMDFDGRQFKIELAVWRAENDLTQGIAGYEDREGGLLILDEDQNVLDLTLFQYDYDPSASKLFGKVKILGAGEYIRSKLNSDPPEGVLTEDREGLERKHSFYKRLAATIEPVLKPIVEEEEARRRLQSGGFSPETIARYNRAIDSLNALYQELVGKADLGDGFTGKKPELPEYLAFIRSELTVTENVLTPLALMINCDKFQASTQATVSSDNEKIVVQPERFAIARQTAESALMTKIVRINGAEAGTTGKIVAKADGHHTETTIHVVDKEIFYPPDGFAFYPSGMRLHESKERKLHLFVDIEKIPIGSTISLRCDSPAFELPTSIDFRENMKINDEVGSMDMPIVGRIIGSKGEVTATFATYSAKAQVQVVKKNGGKPEPPKQGSIFKPPRFDKIPILKVQTWLNPADGTILVNILDPLNSVYFGSEPESARLSVEGSNAKLHCQIRLADLVLDECLNKIVTDAWTKGTIEKRHPNNPEIDIRHYVAEWKYKYGKRIHEHFVTVQSDGFHSENLEPKSGQENQTVTADMSSQYVVKVLQCLALFVRNSWKTSVSNRVLASFFLTPKLVSLEPQYFALANIPIKKILAVK